MKFVDANYIFSATKINDFPKTNLPEFAFTGRSNVGKSSFINSIVLRKNLARTSSNPGKTKAINFYSVEEKFILADLPGFGFAKISKTSREDWKNLIYNYFEKRKTLRFVTVLVDSRHDPMPIDLSLIEWLENNNIKFLIALTKCDKISKNSIQERVQQWNYLVSECQHFLEVLPTSSVNGEGFDTFYKIMKKSI